MIQTKAMSVVQRLSDEYLERCRELSPQDIVRFLEDYRKLFDTARRQREQRAHSVSDSRETTRK